MNISKAWRSSTGPETLPEQAVLAMKGLCMGAADIVPGVSGGTVAFITGIYEQLIAAIRSVNMDVARSLLKLDLTGALSQVHLRFLIPLMLGVMAAIVSMSRVMHYLLHEHPVFIWSLFFGLIAASIIIVGAKVTKWGLRTPACLAGGAIFAWYLTGMIPLTTPETWWFVFLCGMIAICAMILPGISGAFLLLILGKYEYVTGALKDPFSVDNALVIVIFAAGCAVGIAAFSRVLHYLLKNYHNAAIALLTGFILGAMRKVWPWKEALETKVIRDKTYVLQERNILPEQLDAHTLTAIGLMVLGFAAVFGLERITRSGDGAETQS